VHPCSQERWKDEAMTITKTMSDTDIDRAVTQELRWDPRVDDTGIGVSVKNGVVTLAGSVDGYAKRLAACDAAHRVAGVLDVADELQVKYTGEAKNDVEIAKNVRQALVWDVFVSAERIKSTVSSGWVKLEGEVDYPYQREDAARAIERLRGVVGVTNLITVKAARVDPKRIQSSIESTLARRAERGAKRIRVAVEGNTVKLSGTVDSWAEKNEVKRVASCSEGVTKLEDTIVIDPYV
jgi:osmotically-inducible protein OsmY